MLLLLDMGIVITCATVLALFARVLKQPLILAYVLAGIIIGPFGLKLITSEEIIRIFAELGIAFLLFIVGLELDIQRLKTVGKVSAGCGIGQIIITFIFGFGLARILGFPQLISFYIAMALTISSTMVVIKLLSDKRELDTLHGKIALGTLLVQDIFTIMVLAALPTIDNLSASILISSIVTGLGLISIAIFVSKYVLPSLVRYASRSAELLFLFALSWCFLFSLFSYLVFFYILGFIIPPIAIGSFLGGVSLAIFPYNKEIISRIRSLKDFFLTIFFVSLGMQVPLIFKVSLISDIIILSLFVLVVTPFIVFLLASIYGYGKRTSFLTAISLAQISEFSLILGTQGLLLGHISSEVFSLITWVALITITISSYFIVHSTQLYKFFSPLLHIFNTNVKEDKKLEKLPLISRDHVVVCGSHHTGYDIIRTLRKLKKNFLVIDYDPEIIKELKCQGINCIYGDVEDLETLERIGLKHASLIISTVPDHKDNLLLIKHTRGLNPKAFIMARAETTEGALELYEAGANYVIFTEKIGGMEVARLLKRHYSSKNLELEQMKDIRNKDIEELERRKTTVEVRTRPTQT